jgi:hypothetical protein
VLFRFSQPLGRRGNLLGRWRHVVSPRKLLTGKAQNLSSASGISTRALAIVSLEQKIKRYIILSHCLVGIINGVLVASPYFTSCNRAAQRVRGRFGRHLFICPHHAWWRVNLALLLAKSTPPECYRDHNTCA